MSSGSFSPVYDGFQPEPMTLPLGVRFSHRVWVRDIPHRVATSVYESHHSYLPTGRTSGTPVHHGIYFDDSLVGAISYSYMLCSDPILGVEPDRYMEVSRVCIAVDTPNLASCGMSKSQDEFESNYAEENGIDLLLTYVKDGYEGTMFKALKSRGWVADGELRPGGQASNRPERDIRDSEKQRWACPLNDSVEMPDEGWEV